jgi:uncharacterized protein YktB (UPF0637 family)
MTNKEMEHKKKKEFRDKLANIKENAGCADCGIKNQIILDFDHLKDKKYNISQMIRDGFSWKAIMKEVEKCEVVCANCHRIRTHKRRLGIA